MMPLRVLGEDDDWFEDALAALRGADLTDEGTMAHLGVTWGRWMLHPAWDGVWDAEPTKAGGGTPQILVLLSDGISGVRPIDPADTIPGKSWICLSKHPGTSQPMLTMSGRGGGCRSRAPRWRRPSSPAIRRSGETARERRKTGIAAT